MKLKKDVIIRLNKNNDKINLIRQKLKKYGESELVTPYFKWNGRLGEYKFDYNDEVNPFLYGAIGMSVATEGERETNWKRLRNETLFLLLGEIEALENKTNIELEFLIKNNVITTPIQKINLINDDELRFEWIRYILDPTQMGEYKYIDWEEMEGRQFKIIKEGAKPNEASIQIISNQINYINTFKNIFRNFEMESKKLNKTLFIDWEGKGKTPLKYSNFVLIECVETGRQYYILNDYVKPFINN